MTLALTLWAALVSAPGPHVAPPPPRSASILAELEAAHEELFARIAPAVVFIRAADGFGSGFFVSSDGHVLTNQHVVGSADTVKVVTFSGRTLDARVVARGHDGLDLALLEVPIEDPPALALASSRALPIGGWVGSVGHGSGGIWTLSVGLVSNAYGDASRRGVMQTQIPINPGASGGPVFDRHGRVVGVVTSRIERAQAVNFAIRSDAAVQGLPELRALTDCLVIDADAGASIFVDGRLVGRGPRHALLLEAGKHSVTAVIGNRRRRRTIAFPGCGGSI